MFELNGKYATAKIMTDNIEESAITQITELINNRVADGSNIVIMPDVHAGAGCTIGTTMTYTDKIVPNLVGVDIGCTVSAHALAPWVDMDLEKLDNVIRKFIPAGTNVHSHETTQDLGLDALFTPLTEAQISRARKSLGTLGGGNHFISIEKDESEGGYYYLLIHTGSRNLGKLVAEYHQGVAIEYCKRWTDEELTKMIEEAKILGIENRLEEIITQFKQNNKYNRDLCYLTGKDLERYLVDVEIAQNFALKNHHRIAEVICQKMGWEPTGEIYTTHNYVDLERKIIRKGAVDATKAQFLVPLNMRDGTLIFSGNESPSWNFSAPHGAGRIMSRSQAKRELSVDEFEAQMQGIYSSSIDASTLDEAPQAYKPAQEIIEAVNEVYSLQAHLKPIYNFKASE